jgi:hypothetical protein
MSSHFVTVFDIAQKQPDWKMLLTPASVMLASIAYACWEFLTKRRFKYLMVAVVFAFVAFVVGYGFYKGSTYGLAEARAALREGRFSVLEGRVTDFVPMPVNGHAEERFTVSGVQFSYSDYVILPCFNHTSTRGGPIRAGIWVRLSYQGNCILRVEVWQPAGSVSDQ